MISKIIYLLKNKITKLIISEEVLINKINSYKINKCIKSVEVKAKTQFYETTKIINLQNKKESIRIGENCHIRGEILIYPYGDGILIGNYCYLGENSIIRAGEKITIGNNVLIANNVTIIDTDSHEINYQLRHLGFKTIIESGHPLEKGAIQTSPIIINDNVWISYNASILKGVTIGEGAIIAAGSVVTKDVEAFTMVAGNPAIFIKHLPQ